MKETLKLLEKKQVNPRSVINTKTRKFSNFLNFTKLKLIEAFGCGTACVVCPIESILYKDQKYHIPTMDTGAKVMNRIAKQLNDIQYGKIKHEWAPLVEDEWMPLKMNVTN